MARIIRRVRRQSKAQRRYLTLGHATLIGVSGAVIWLCASEQQTAYVHTSETAVQDMETHSQHTVEEYPRIARRSEGVNYILNRSSIGVVDSRVAQIVPSQPEDSEVVRQLILPVRLEDAELLRRLDVERLQVDLRLRRTGDRAKVLVRVYTDAVRALPQVTAPHRRRRSYSFGHGRHRGRLLMLQASFPVEREILPWACYSSWKWVLIGDGEQEVDEIDAIPLRVLEVSCFKRAYVDSWFLHVMEQRIKWGVANTGLPRAFTAWLLLPWPIVLFLFILVMFVHQVIALVVRLVLPVIRGGPRT